MFELFCKYLFLHQKASIPGIGVFYIKRNTAKLDFANKVFVAPTYQVVFNANVASKENKHFSSFISLDQEIEEAEASILCDDFAKKLRENISLAKEADLPGLGQLIVDPSGELQFHSIEQLQYYFPNVAAERVLRNEPEFNILLGDKNVINTNTEALGINKPEVAIKNDYWWIYAIILAIIGIAAIVNYYFQNGSFE